MVGVGVIVVVLIIVPDEHRSFIVRLHRDGQHDGLGRRSAPDTLRSIAFWYVFLRVCSWPSTRSPASTRLRTRPRRRTRLRDRPRSACTCPSSRLGLLRLHPAGRGHLGYPGHAERVDTSSSTSSRTIWVAGDGPELGDVPALHLLVAQFFCLTASVTSASRMIFAFSRDRAVPGHQLWRRVASNRVPHMSVIAIVVRGRGDHAPGDLELLRRLLRGNGDRRHRPVHRLHPPRVSCAGGMKDELTSRARGRSASTTSGSTRSRSSGSSSSASSSSCRRTSIGAAVGGRGSRGRQ